MGRKRDMQIPDPTSEKQKLYKERKKKMNEILVWKSLPNCGIWGSVLELTRNTYHKVSEHIETEILKAPGRDGG